LDGTQVDEMSEGAEAPPPLTRRQQAQVNDMLARQRKLLRQNEDRRRKQEVARRKQERQDRRERAEAHKVRKAVVYARRRYENRRLGLKRKPSRCRIIVKDGKPVESINDGACML
jgi:hypothetical protein